jgi:hypothetical protein
MGFLVEEQARPRASPAARTTTTIPSRVSYVHLVQHMAGPESSQAWLERSRGKTEANASDGALELRVFTVPGATRGWALLPTRTPRVCSILERKVHTGSHEGARGVARRWRPMPVRSKCQLRRPKRATSAETDRVDVQLNGDTGCLEEALSELWRYMLTAWRR